MIKEILKRVQDDSQVQDDVKKSSFDRFRMTNCFKAHSLRSCVLFRRKQTGQPRFFVRRVVFVQKVFFRGLVNDFIRGR